MKILFIQLPLIDHSLGYIDGNVPVASTTIGGYLKKRYKNVQCEYLPYIITNYCSDNTILKYVLNSDPAIIAFTTFLWNIERSLDIAHGVKKLRNDIKIFFGGSEIQQGSIALEHHHPWVDFFVMGEGEWFFSNYFSNRDFRRYLETNNGNSIVIQPAQDLIPVDDIFEPFTGRELQIMPDGSTFIEYMRGCPYKCSYCFYSKAYPTIRELSFQYILNAVQDRSVPLTELYILSPSLNITRDFDQKMGSLARFNAGIRLHSEMRSIDLDKKKAPLLYQAGFRSLEIGLQTINKATLDGVGRRANIVQELEGMQYLKKAGIELKIGIIPGLPGESASSFMGTVDLLIKEGFQNSIELYPLMLLPGTGLRDKAVKENIRYLSKPPYYYTGGWEISHSDILTIQSEVEEKTGLSHWVNRLPDFCHYDNGLFVNGIRFNGDSVENWNSLQYQPLIQTNVFNFHITITNTANIHELLLRFLSDLPGNELFNFIFYSQDIMNESRIEQCIESIDRDHFYHRMNLHNEWRGGVRFHIYQVFQDRAKYETAKKQYITIVPIIHITVSNSSLLLQVGDDDHILLGHNLIENITDIPIPSDGNIFEQIAFEDGCDQETYFLQKGISVVSLPFNFRTVSAD